MIGNKASVGDGESAYCLDTSVIILSLRGDTAVRSRLAAATTLYTSSVALGELYYGAYNSPSRVDEATLDIDQIVTSVTPLSVDHMTAKIYAHVKRDLKLRGLTMPENDIWIASIAIQYRVTLAARDVHFSWISDLASEQW